MKAAATNCALARHIFRSIYGDGRLYRGGYQVEALTCFTSSSTNSFDTTLHFTGSVLPTPKANFIIGVSALSGASRLSFQAIMHS
jgi:hypothetical protein